MAEINMNKEMNRIKVVLLDSDCRFSNSIIDTPFYIMIDTIAFPDKEWTDFTYPVLCIWIETILRNQGREAKFTLPFMDGPFYIEVEQFTKTLQLKGISRRKERVIEFNVSIHLLVFLNELYRALNKLEMIVVRNTFDGNHDILWSIQHYKKHLAELIEKAKTEAKATH